MAKALARIMIGKVVDRRRKSDIEREAAQKVRIGGISEIQKELFSEYDY